MDSYLVLLRVGFTLPFVLPRTRCALTAPFHPYQAIRRGLAAWRYIFCGTVRRLAPPRRYLAPCPMEPGLSSISHRLPTLTMATAAKLRSPGRLPKGENNTYLSQYQAAYQSRLPEESEDKALR